MTDKIINLNLDLNAPPAILHVTQGDTAWAWHFRLFMDGSRWTIPTGAQIIFKGLKPDGHVFAFSGAVSSNEAVVTSDLQMTICAGEVPCSLIILDANAKRLAFGRITMYVAADAEGQFDVASESALPAYVELLEQYAQLIDEAASIPDDLPGYITENVAAWLDDHPEATTTVQDGAVTKAKLAAALVAELTPDATLSLAGKPADAKAAGDAVGELKSAFPRFEHPADNIVTELLYTQGGYYISYNGTTQTFVSSDNWGYTDLIACEANTEYYLNTTAQYWCFYDDNKTFIGFAAGNHATTPNNCSFLRISVSKTGQQVARLTKNSVYKSKIDKIYQDIYGGTIEYLEGENNGFFNGTNVQSGSIQKCTLIEDLSDIESFSYDATVAPGTYSVIYILDESNNIVRRTYNMATGHITISTYKGKKAYINFFGPTFSTNVKATLKNSYRQNWSSLRWCVLGDSLTEKNYRADMSYYDYISHLTGISVVNWGRSGTGYMAPDAFATRINNEIDFTAFDFITIFGSGNDLGKGYVLGTPNDLSTDNTICGHIVKAINAVNAKAPNMKLGIITPTPWVGYCNSDGALNKTVDGDSLETYSNYIVEICKKRGIPCLDLYHESGLKPWNADFRQEYYNEAGVQDAGVHPNSLGHKWIYPMFYDFLQRYMVF